MYVDEELMSVCRLDNVEESSALISQFPQLLLEVAEKKKYMKRWNIQHVASVGQRKNLSTRRESNP